MRQWDEHGGGSWKRKSTRTEVSSGPISPRSPNSPTGPSSPTTSTSTTILHQKGGEGSRQQQQQQQRVVAPQYREGGSSSSLLSSGRSSTSRSVIDHRPGMELMASSPRLPPSSRQLSRFDLSSAALAPPASPQWRPTQGGGRAMPKSAMLMQSFLKATPSTSIPPSPSTARRECVVGTSNGVSDSKQPSSNSDEPDTKAKDGTVEAEEGAWHNPAHEECVFNFEGLFEELQRPTTTTKTSAEGQEQAKPAEGHEGTEKGSTIGGGERRERKEKRKKKQKKRKEHQEQNAKAKSEKPTTVTETSCELMFQGTGDCAEEVQAVWPVGHSAEERCSIRIEPQKADKNKMTSQEKEELHIETDGELDQNRTGAEPAERIGGAHAEVAEVDAEADAAHEQVLQQQSCTPSTTTTTTAQTSQNDRKQRRKRGRGRRQPPPPPLELPAPIPPDAVSPTTPSSCSLISRTVETIRIAGIQLRKLALSSSKDVFLVVSVRIDGLEMFRSGPVRPNGNSCVISEEFTMELPRPCHFHSLQMSLVELADGARVQRCIGKLRMTSQELQELGDAIQDRWMPIARVRPIECSETIGSLCAELSLDGEHKTLTMRVFDFIAWNLSAGRANPLDRHANENSLLLKCRVVFGRVISPMQKMHLTERRGIEPIRFDCAPFLCTDHHHHKSPPLSADQWLTSCWSVCSSPAGAFGGTPSLGHPRRFRFPPPPNGRTTPGAEPEAEECRVLVRIYGASGTEDSFCGSVLIPLDPSTMEPRELPPGPNWFNVRSNSTATILAQQRQQFYNNDNNTASPTPSFSASSKRLTTATPGSPSPSLKNSPTKHQSRHRRDRPDSHRQQQLAPTSSASSPALHQHCCSPSTSFSSSATFSKDAIPRPGQPNSLKTPSISSLFTPGNGDGDGRKEHNNHPLDPKQLQRHSLVSSSSHLSNTAVFGGHTKTGSIHQNNMGEVRLKLWYSMDEISPSVHYQPLYLNLVRSLNVTPHSDSLISLIQKYWPADIENLAKPLMKIYLHTNQIRQFFRMICSQYVLTCNNVNTLFRSQSLASKVMYEMMKFVGYKYLVVSLKPLIDLIFAERKCCEIDPSKIKSGDSIEQNFRNVTTYAELAFNRVVESLPRCPQALREIFAELRQVVEQYYPGREDVARLALSSFLIMRFFAAAILNPKLFALKLETPDIEVSRTLVLISKILQRLANCVVSANPLTNKEEWLTPVLQRFSDGSHKIAMIRFLDDISTTDTDENNHPEAMNTVNDENISPVHSPEQAILKSGFLIERRNGPVKKRSFKNFIHPKRRLVVLTDSMLNWQKGGSVKDASTISSASSSAIVSNPLSRDYNGNAEQKSQIAISDVTSVSVLPDAKNSFRVTTMSTEVHFQASNENEMNEWIIMIQKQQRRHLMVLNNRSSSKFPTHTSSTAFRAIVEVDLDRELHTVFKHLSDHLDALCDHGWCCRYRCARCERGCIEERQPTEEDGWGLNSEPMVVTDPIQRTNATPS